MWCEEAQSPDIKTDGGTSEKVLDAKEPRRFERTAVAVPRCAR